MNIARRIMRVAPWIAMGGLLLTIASSFYAIRLYRNLRTEFEELLPTQSRSVRDLSQVESRMESTESLAILAFSDHPEESKRFVQDLGNLIDRELRGLISHVEYRIDREMEFYKRRQALMLDIDDLVRIKDYIRDSLRYEREIRNPLNIVSGVTLLPPTLDRQALVSKYSSRTAEFDRFKEGFYASPDGKIRVILVYVSGRALGVENAVRLRAGVDRLIARLDPKRYAPDLTIKFTGDVENLIEERDSIVSDLVTSTVIVAVLVVLAMAVFYRDALGTAALVASLFAGTLWTFGVSYFAVGYLNANSAFLGSIVMGNGINFGIVLLARYLEERRRMAHEQALERAYYGALPGTLTAALAAGLAYGSLAFTAFRGFRQFGVIGLIGMLLCWVASFTLLPAALTLLDRFRKRPPLRIAFERRRGFGRLASWLTCRFPRAVLVACLGLTLALVPLALRHRGPILETDTSKLRDRRSLQKGSGYLSRYLDQIFGRYLSPLVILPSDRKYSSAIARSLKQLQREQGADSLIADVYSIEDFVPPDQLEKIRVLGEIRAELSPQVLANLSPQDTRLVRAALTPEASRPFGIEDLPPVLKARFRERDGTVGAPVLVEPVFDAAVMSEFANQKRLIDEVRATADSVDPTSAVVGQLPLTVDMIASIERDGPRATLLAFAAVFALSIVLFRRPAAVLEAVFALLLGVGWMVCAALALNLKVNFLNFIALPITFGIGVDYGVNVLSRVRSQGRRDLALIVATTGSAVSLASLTTIIGYSSLLIAGNQGFVSFGKLAVLGELTCLSAALFALPAFIRWQALRAGATPLPAAEGEVKPREKRAA